VFKKFFGKKNDGFYLQLEDEQASSQPTAKTKTPDPAPAKPEPVATSTPPVAAVKEAASVAPATKSVAEPAATVEKKSLKTEKKSAQKAQTPKKVEAPAPVAVAAPVAPPITNFATDYLIKPSSNSSRRQPGANMNGFLELARQVQKPANFKATAAERKKSAE
jgi:hypothetical protein